MNKKVILLAALAFCVGHFFGVTQEDVVQKLPDGIDQKSVISIRKREGNEFDFVYKEGNSYFIHSCGKKIGPFKSVPRMIISGDNLAYVFTDENEKWHVVLNEKELGIYEELYVFSFMSSDPDKCTFHAKKDDGWYIITEENSYGPFDKKVEFFLRKKNGSICYCIQEEGFDYVYTDGEKRGPFNFVDTNGFFMREVESFIYSWADIYSNEYHLCIDGKDSEAYNSLEFFPSDDGRLYYIYETVDFKTTRLMCDGKILKELNAYEYGTAPSSSSYDDRGLCLSLGSPYIGESALVFLIKDGEIKAEIETERVPLDDEIPYFPFTETWISCTAGKFGPYGDVSELEFDKFGRAFWSAMDMSGNEGLYVDGKLIYESDMIGFIYDFDTIEDKFIIITGDYNKIIANGKRYVLGAAPTFLDKFLDRFFPSIYSVSSPMLLSDSLHIVFDPRLLQNGNDFLFFYYTDDYRNQYLFHDGTFYKAFCDEKFIYFIDENSIKRIEFN